MDERFKIVCGACNGDPRLFRDADGELVVCSGCGQRDSFDAASRIAAAHSAHRGAGYGPMLPNEKPFRWQSVRV